MTPTLVKLSENEQRLIISLLLIVILAFVIVGYISLLIKKVMEKQATKADGMLQNVVKAEYFDNERSLKRFGRKKNGRVFFKQARIPFLIMLVSMIGLLLYCLFKGDWHYNPFNSKDGFGTLFFLHDWSDKSTYTTRVFFLTVMSNMPPRTHTPEFVWSAWFSYLFVPAMTVGLIWYLIEAQAFIARSFRVNKIARGIYRKKLVPDDKPQTPINNQNTPTNN